MFLVFGLFGIGANVKEKNKTLLICKRCYLQKIQYMVHGVECGLLCHLCGKKGSQQLYALLMFSVVKTKSNVYKMI